MADSPILMPKLGLTMEEGQLASWSVKAGDTVKAGDILFVVETDKIANEVEARDAGTIVELLVKEGETVPVGAVLATWTGPSAGGGDEAAAPAPAPAAEAAPAPAPAPEPAPAPAAPAPAAKAASDGNRVVATPLARRLARQGKVDLSAIAGSGPRGRIKAVDIERAGSAAPAAKPAAPAPAAATAAAPATGETRRKPSLMEKTIARRLTESKQNIPHFYVLADADVTRLLALRKQLNDAGSDVKISVNHCIIAAVARALGQMPEMNAVWDEGEIVSFDGIDIGVAVDSSKGLLVPVLRNLGGVPLPGVAQASDVVVAKARDGKLGPTDMAGGVISVSNVGMFGAGFLVPIINPGQSAILGVGSPKQVFRPDAKGQPELRQEVGLVLSCDHRVHDGVRAAKMLDLIVKALENPLRLLMP